MKKRRASERLLFLLLLIMLSGNHSIIGHSAPRDFLEKSLANSHLAQAYLFAGASGLGKKKLARWFIEKIIVKMGPAPVLPHPSGVGGRSNFASQSGEGAFPFQIKLVERIINPKTGKKNKDISLEQIQEIQEFLSHHSFLGKIKAVVIDGVGSLNQHAANALLKVLEEPKDNCFLFLLAENGEEVLPTIASRCQLIFFNSVSSAEIYQALLERGADAGLASEISYLACGQPGRALDFYHDLESLKIYKNQRQEFLTILTSNDLNSAFSAIEPYFKKKADHIEGREILISLLENWVSVCRDLVLSQAGVRDQLPRKKERVNSLDVSEDLLQISLAKISLQRLAKIIESVWESKEWLNQNIHPKLVMENLILNLL